MGKNKLERKNLVCFILYVFSHLGVFTFDDERGWRYNDERASEKREKKDKKKNNPPLYLKQKPDEVSQ